ncbi:MAG: hypothetical protein AB7S26_30120 [Sandaracinaceae bacterium]
MAVEGLRSALIVGDVEAAQSYRWLQPRPPGERDLLSDLAAAEGIGPAVRRLARFWRHAQVQLEAVRTIDALEAEVYERLTLPTGSLPMVSLVRRENLESEWRVVCTNEARDERFILWVSVPTRTIDDVQWSRAFNAPGALCMTDDGGVLGHPDRGWLAHVNGPFVPDAWPDNLPGEGGWLLEIAAALAPDAAERREELRWLLAAAANTIELTGGSAAYLPSEKKLLAAEAVRRASQGGLTGKQVLRFWTRTQCIDEHVSTDGMRLLGLPELEAPVSILGSAEATERLLMWLAAPMIEEGAVPPTGTELVLDGPVATLVAGRRGPRRGASYGRWGALAITLDPGAFPRGSRTRLRVPREVFHPPSTIRTDPPLRG